MDVKSVKISEHVDFIVVKLMRGLTETLTSRLTETLTSRLTETLTWGLET